MLKRESSERPTTPQFCTQCGTRMGDGHFCPSCGALAIPEDLTSEAGPFERSQAAANAATERVESGQIHEPAALAEAETVAEDVPSAAGAPTRRPPAPAAPSTGPRRWIFAAVAVGALIVVGGVVAAIVLTSGGSNATNSAYGQRLASVFAPVTSDNHSLSSALSSLHGQDTGAAKSAASQAQSDTTRAQGALGALNTPAGSQQVAGEARQALDREQTYLGAVAAVLSDPSNPSGSQLQTLAGNLTTALDAVGSPLAGASQSVSGAENLTSWANHTAQQQQQQRSSNNSSSGGQQSSNSGSSSQQGSSSSGQQAGPFANGRDCGGNLFAGPNTSCSFAQNTQAAYNAAPGLVTTVSVYSPVTGQTYEMSCSPAGNGVTCSGGNNASVSWTW